MDRSVNRRAVTMRVFPTMASSTHRNMFIKKEDPNCTGRSWNRTGSMARDSKMYVTRIINTGRAEFPVNFFWKTFDNGLEIMRVKTNREVTMNEIITFELTLGFAQKSGIRLADG